MVCVPGPGSLLPQIPITAHDPTLSIYFFSGVISLSIVEIAFEVSVCESCSHILVCRSSSSPLPSNW